MRRFVLMALVLVGCGGGGLPGTWEARGDEGTVWETLTVRLDGTYERYLHGHPATGYTPEAGTWEETAAGLRMVRIGSPETDRWSLGSTLRIWWTIAIPTPEGSHVSVEYQRVK